MLLAFESLATIAHSYCDIQVSLEKDVVISKHLKEGVEDWGIQFATNTSNSGSSLPLIFCIHVSSGPIYWGGVIYLAKKFIR